MYFIAEVVVRAIVVIVTLMMKMMMKTPCQVLGTGPLGRPNIPCSRHDRAQPDFPAKKYCRTAVSLQQPYKSQNVSECNQNFIMPANPFGPVNGSLFGETEMQRKS